MSTTTRETETAIGVVPLGRPFGVHLGGVGVANLADGIMAAGIPLIAVSLTRSPGEISMLQVALWTPWLLLGLVAGVLVDRVDRRQVQLIAMGVRTVLLVGLTWVTITDQLSIWLLVAFALGYGMTEVFIDVAASAIVPALAPRSRLSAANGRVLAIQQIGGTFVGAPVGAALLVVGAGWVVGVPAALGIAFVLLIGLGLRGRRFVVERDAPVSIRADIGDGLRFLWHHPVLRPNLVAGGLMNMANTGYFAVFVLFVVGAGSAVGLRPEHYPLLSIALPVGAVLGSVLTERLTTRIAEVPTMYVCWALNSALLLVPVLSPTPAAITAAMFGLGLTNTIGNVISQTIRQRLVPSQLLGRVGGAGRMVGYGLMPVGALLGGQLAEAFGLVPVFVGAALVCLVAVAWVATQVNQSLVDSLDQPDSSGGSKQL
jgi:MFS family permease